ncbi:MAG TPA: hypothetical protein VGR53_06985 [Nitrososphaerales archaeon]|nr:hypothetical protein [Nitrososphaerales archaeon]
MALASKITSRKKQVRKTGKPQLRLALASYWYEGVALVAIPSSEDKWYLRTLFVRYDLRDGGISTLLGSALEVALTHAEWRDGTLVGFMQTSGEVVVVNVLLRPTRRNDKSFLYSAIANRHDTRTRFSDREAIQYLLVSSTVLRDIGIHAGIIPFFEAMNYVTFGVFSYGPGRIVYYPLKPDATMFSTDPSIQSTHDYETPKYLTNLLAERALISIGKVDYV